MAKRIIILLSIVGILTVAAYIAWQANVAVAQQAPDDQERPAFRERQGDGERGQRRQFRRPEGGRGPGGMFGFRGMTGGVAICATDQYVYVARGNTLYQFEADGLELAAKVKLEEEPAQPRGPGQRRGGRRGPPPEQKDHE